MDLHNEKITVVGLGKTALAVVKLLVREGARPFVTEKLPREKVAHYCDELEELGVPYECGGHSREAFDGARLVVPSPGVPPNLAPIREALDKGSEVVGEMELASRYCRCPVLAVTGTNGKTTTTELLKTLVEGAGRSVTLAGNNAHPFSTAVMESTPPEFIILEVSSYQLETAVTFRPRTAAVLNVSPDHLERHGTLEEYAAVKRRLFDRQGEGDGAVVNYDDPFTRAMAPASPVATKAYSVCERLSQGLWVDGETILDGDEAIASTDDVPIRGRHNLSNALAALAMMRLGNFEWDGVLAGLRRFQGVEHRIEYVATVDGADYYNDSKSTNIDSLGVALDSFDGPVVLIAGGRGKGSDYGALREKVRTKVKTVIVFGEDAPAIKKAFSDAAPVHETANLEEAVAEARRTSIAGDVVLLSPACASFDMFENFEERGRAFKARVHALQQ